MWNNLPLRAIPIIAYEAIKEARSYITNFILFVLIGYAAMDVPKWLTIFMQALAGIFLIFIVIKAYTRFRYRFDDDHIENIQGVFNKRYVRVNKDSINHFTVSQTIVQKILGLWTLNLFSETSASPVATIRHITHSNVLSITDCLKVESSKGQAPETDVASIQHSSFATLFIGSIHRYSGIGLALLLPVILFFQEEEFDVQESFVAVDKVKEFASFSFESLFLAVSLYYLMYLFASLIGKASFTLDKYFMAKFWISENGDFHGKSGFLNRSDWTISKKGISKLIISTNVVMENLGFFDIELVSNTSGTKHKIPGVNKNQLDTIMRHLEMPIHSRHRYTFSSYRCLPEVVLRVILTRTIPLYLLALYVVTDSIRDSVSLYVHAITWFAVTLIWSMNRCIAQSNNGFTSKDGMLGIANASTTREYNYFSRAKIRTQGLTECGIYNKQLCCFDAQIAMTDVEVAYIMRKPAIQLFSTIVPHSANLLDNAFVATNTTNQFAPRQNDDHNNRFSAEKTNPSSA